MISSKKAIGGSIAAILVLLVSQVVAQLLASVLVIIKIPTGICNIVAGVLYFVFTYFLLKVLMSKILKLNMADCRSVIALIAYIVVAVFAFVMIKKKRKD